MRVCIIGVGLIGGSLGQALRRVRKSGRRRYAVIGLGRDRKSLTRAKRLGAVDQFSTSTSQALENADVVVVCIPVHQIPNFLHKNLTFFKSGSIVTDVGSVKGIVADAMRIAAKKRTDVSFVGGHPIAGSERTGVEFAKPDLFKRAACVLTRDAASFKALDVVRSMWKDVGARCFLMNASDHDHFLALTSHLPHLLAFALFSEVEMVSKKSPIVKSLVGGSFRDMTRIAGADPELWTGIVSSNRKEIQKVSARFVKQLRHYSSFPASNLRQHLKTLARAKASF